MAVPVANSGIAARAFEFLELRPLSSVADGSALATQAAAALADARQLCLSAHDWGAASRTVTLARNSADPDPIVLLGASYALPHDFLVIREVTAGGCPVQWRQEGRALLADATDALVLRYTADIADETGLSVHLRLAIAYRMAVLMTDRNTTSTSKKEAMMAGLRSAEAEARRHDRTANSSVRWDGQSPQGDWVSEATR